MCMAPAPQVLALTRGRKKMEYESEILDLKKRVDELEKCCQEFRACKGSMGERIEALKKNDEEMTKRIA